jgi:SAM-dependent methyltransferase
MTTSAQPIRRGADERGERDFDKTSLHERVHGKWVHRDYAAHYFRWGFASRFAPGGQNVLDVGCGPELPLMKVLVGTPYQSRLPVQYVGVDLNKIKDKPDIDRVKILDETDFTSEEGFAKVQPFGPFQLATCFEVVEHMQPASALRLVKNVARVADEGIDFLVSTPVYDGKARARNHIHEFEVQELADLFAEGGWRVVRRFGTFGNIPALKKAATEEQRALMAELSAYYSYDVLCTFLAPLYPDACRNNCWHLRKA